METLGKHLQKSVKDLKNMDKVAFTEKLDAAEKPSLDDAAGLKKTSAYTQAD